MKKIISLVFLCFVLGLQMNAFAEKNTQISFPEAIRTCEKYSNTGEAKYANETFGIAITLEKTRNHCVYKEKIFQGKDYQLLTCKFNEYQAKFIADSTEKYNKHFAKEIAKNNIFEAKLTNNGEIFQKYLINNAICEITYSKKIAN